MLRALIVVLLLLGAGCVSLSLAPAPRDAAPLPSSSASSAPAGAATTFALVAAGAFASASDKEGTGGATVLVRNVTLSAEREEVDGDEHLYAADATMPRFMMELIPRDREAVGLPPTGVTIWAQGVPFCDHAHEGEAWHGSTCWELHPLLAWGIEGQQLPPPVDSAPLASAPSDAPAPAPSTTNATGLRVNATVDPVAPCQDARVVVRVVVTDDSGAPVANATVGSAWRYKSGTSTLTNATDARGEATFARSIGRAAVGFAVVVDVDATIGALGGRASTSFTPSC